MLFFEELARRNVFRLGLAYVATSWLIIQAAETIFPAFGFGPDAVRNVIIALTIGLLPACLFAWLYELTPEGLKLERNVDRGTSITPRTGKLLDRIIIVVLVLALSYFAIDKFLLDPGRDAANIQEAADKARSGAIVDAYGEQSIAVLPFVDMSPNGDQEYFSDGIAEELIHLLTRVPDLRVISRSSAFSFKGERIDIPTLAEKLNVGHVLEGSVRISGDRLRITAQLIEARSDTQLWSQNYDRLFDDIFAIQDEISAEVVAQLKVRLLTPDIAPPAINPEAYALFLQARHLSRLSTAEGFEQAVALYQQSIAIDPGMTEAWNGLSRTYLNQSLVGVRPADEGFELGREATLHLLQLDPYHAIGHSRLGWIAMAYDRDFQAAAQHMETAFSLAPNDPAVAANTGTLCIFLGRADEGIRLYETALLRDPVNVSMRTGLGQIYTWAERYDDAIESLQTSLVLSPNKLLANFYLGVAFLLSGDNDSAMAAMRTEPLELLRLIGISLVQYSSGHQTESDAALSEVIDKHGKNNPYHIAYLLAYRDESDRAFEWLYNAEQANDPKIVEIVGEPLFANLYDDPRWQPFLRKLDKSPDQLATIKLDLGRP